MTGETAMIGRSSLRHSAAAITTSDSLRLWVREMQRSLDAALDALSRSVTPVTVHACRTQTRRLRALLRTFRHAFNAAQLARYQKGLRRLTRELAPVRSADVELQLIERLARERSIPEADGLQEVRVIAARARSREAWDLRARLVGSAWRKRRERLRQASSDPKLIVESRAPMAAMVARVLKRRRRRLHSLLRAQQRSAKALHKRRQKIRILRYLLERCAPNNAAVRAELRQLRLLQDGLGEFRDQWILRRHLARHRPQLRANTDIRSLLLAQRRELLHRVEEHQHQLLRIWKVSPPGRIRDSRAAAAA